MINCRQHIKLLAFAMTVITVEVKRSAPQTTTGISPSVKQRSHAILVSELAGVAPVVTVI